ncbi:chymotrypsin family serine protease [Lentzea atacamensis]|uniref:hypothetical protein n=1 Tax=Lentzea atacamensis TaxID=531938 RepID=UPI0011B82C81|nr:hypothetical protein [Lentzea atacamensis]
MATVAGVLLAPAVAASPSSLSKSAQPVQDVFAGIDPKIAEAMRKQIAPGEAYKLLQPVVSQRIYSGYMSAVVEDDRLVLWWKGDLPAPVRVAVESARRIAPIEIRSAKYSRAELDAAADELVKVTAAAGIHSVAIRADGSGITVSKVPGSGPAALTDFGVPVDTKYEEMPKFTSRQNDSAPWWGGTWAINAKGSGECSIGFPVTNASAGQWIITAAHCATPPDLMRDGAREDIGRASIENWQHDILLVNASVMGAGQGYINTGGATDGTSVRIGGWQDSLPGEYYCQSGANSGSQTGAHVCGLRVEPNFMRELCDVDSDGDRFCATDLVAARNDSGGLAVRFADSGGPVYGLTTDNRAIARGVISGGGDNLRVMYFQDWRTIWDDFRVWPVTP